MFLKKLSAESLAYYGVAEVTIWPFERVAQARWIDDRDKRDPPTPEALKGAISEIQGKRRRSVSGVDLVLQAPKAVSVAFALSDDAARETIVVSHAEAVARALRYLEVTDFPSGGMSPHRGFTGASFTHLLSRNHDPHIHDHLVIVNGFASTDGTKRALDLEHLRRSAPVAVAIYRREFARALSCELGLELVGPLDGVQWIKGQPFGLNDIFSTRSAEVRTHSARFGDSARARAIGALANRPDKVVVDLKELSVRWHRDAHDALDKAMVRSRGTFGEPIAPLFVSPVPNAFHSEVLFHLARSPEIEVSEAVRRARDAIQMHGGKASPEVDISALEPRLGPPTPSTMAQELHRTALDALLRLSVRDDGGGLVDGPCDVRTVVPRTRRESRYFEAIGLRSSSNEPLLRRRGSVAVGGLSRLSLSEVATMKGRGRLSEISLDVSAPTTMSRSGVERERTRLLALEEGQDRSRQGHEYSGRGSSRERE